MKIDNIYLLKKFISLGGFLFIMMTINACKTYPSIDYDFVDVNGKRLTTVKMDINAYEKLIIDGSVFYIEFHRFGNNKFFQPTISLYTLQKHDLLKIHSIEFEFENKIEVIKINKTIKLNLEEDLFIVEDNKELKLDVFFEYLSYEYNSLKMYMQKIFKKNKKNIGEEINLIVRINYSFATNEVFIQEIRYIVWISKGWATVPDWKYKLFPGI